MLTVNPISANPTKWLNTLYKTICQQSSDELFDYV